MNWLIVIIVFLTVVLIVIPTTALLIIWIKSYNRAGLIYREVGDNPNQANRTLKKFKVKNTKGLGQYIHFMFGFLPDTKSFSTKNWYYVNDGRKSYMGVPLYLQRETYRPLVLKKDPVRLEPDTVDSREFRLRSFIHKAGHYENHQLYLFAIGSFVVFMAILAVSYALTNYYLSTDIVTSVLTNTPSKVVIGS